MFHNKKYKNKNYSRDSVIPHEKALEINLIRMNKYLSKRNRIKDKNNLVVMPDLLNAAPVNRLKVNQHCSLYDLFQELFRAELQNLWNSFYFGIFY